MPPQLVYPHLRSTSHSGRDLIAIRDRLRSAIDVLNDSNCFVTDQPIPMHMPNGAYCVTVAPG
jgi:N-formylglutamate amidohydrolase